MQAKRIFDSIQIHRVIGANADLATLETLRAHIWLHVLIVLLVFEVSRVDIVGDPFCLVVVLFASSDLATMPCLHILSFLSPAVDFHIAVQKRVVHCHYTEFRIPYRSIDKARATEENRFGAVALSRFVRCLNQDSHFS